MIRIAVMVVGPVRTNCYIVYDAEAGECVLVDPGDDAAGIMRQCEKLGVKPSAILLTHGHFDHITAVPKLLETYPGLPVYAYKEEAVLLEDGRMNESSSVRRTVELRGVHYLEDREKLELLGETWELIATPGHTVGSCCYYIEDMAVLFSGDTLFCGDCGRTDLATGNTESILHSIREVLMKLPDEVNVLPGHEEMTTIGAERRQNIVMRMR